ncbi:MAG: hypothetical protein ACRYG8_40045 [Janthinobacterium lividum]
MTNFPEIAALSWLQNERLDVVSTAEFTVVFSFDCGGVVQSQALVEITLRYGRIANYAPDARTGDWLFQHIIGDEIPHLKRSPDVLQLAFKAGAIVRFDFSCSPYESGYIRHRNGHEDWF